MNAQQIVTVVSPKLETRLLPRWNVILWDDDQHTYAYVQAMMIELFGHSPQRAYLIAEEVDTSGRAIVWTTHKDRAELLGIFSVPTFVMDGRILATGVPAQEKIIKEISSCITC